MPRSEPALRHCVLDIETAPLDGVENLLPAFRPRPGTKDEEKQRVQVEEKRAKAIAEAALDPDLCRIAAIGSWWDDQSHPILHLCPDEDAERDVLIEFWQLFSLVRRQYPDTCIVGSNVLAFDLVVMVRRSLYLQVDVPPLERGKYRHRDVIDLKVLLCDDEGLEWRSLDYYCRRFALDVPQDDADGSQIPALVAAGDWEAVRSHLLCDLIKTRALARRVVPALREVAA